MFRQNKTHQQSELFGTGSLLVEKKREKLEASQEAVFYKLIFCQIPEKDFSVLYSQIDSRPNAPVNTLVAAWILKHHHGWSYEQLFDHIDFDLKTRLALGLRDLNQTPFSPATLFNFQNRLTDHTARTGENLLERVFDRLTQGQLKALNLKTNIQRADSFLAASNIRDYSRLQLLIEVLQRFVRVLGESEQASLSEALEPYLQQTSGQYLYRLDPEAIGGELATLGGLYQRLLTDYGDSYGDTEAYRILRRVFTEHFSAPDGKIQPRPAEQLHSGCLQSPDDPEATYRKREIKPAKGRRST